MFRPKVDNHKIKQSFESSAEERITCQLRTGFVGLNEYLHKCNIKDSVLCHCASKESVGHFCYTVLSMKLKEKS